VAVADRLDSLVGLCAVGCAPSASADPFGLRRRCALPLLMRAAPAWGPCLRRAPCIPAAAFEGWRAGAWPLRGAPAAACGLGTPRGARVGVPDSLAARALSVWRSARR